MCLRLLLVLLSVHALAVCARHHHHTPRDATGLRLPHFFSEHMVLQRAPLSAAVWGWSVPQDSITVTIADITTSVESDATGQWQVALPPHAAGGPYALSVQSAVTGRVLQLNDVLFGDVYLCAGQSNMQFTVSMGMNAAAEIADADNYPLLRVFTAALNSSHVPLDDMKSKAPDFAWAASSNHSIGGADWSYFSAVCYFFGRDLYRQLNGTVPIGLVASAYGGTCVEAWSSPDVIDRCTTKRDTLCDWPPVNASAHARQPYSSLWNGMLHPLRKLALTAWIWYQGEQNQEDPVGFACRLPLYLTDVRQKFGRPDLPVFVVQLHSCGGCTFVDIRAAQALVSQQLAGVWTVPAFDLGDHDSPFGSGHPRLKQQVGARVARAALRELYGAALTASGPVVLSRAATQSGNETTYSLEMVEADHMFLNDTAGCAACCRKSSAFELLDAARGEWVAAAPSDVLIDNERHVLHVSALLSGPAGGIRYAWSAWPDCALLNGDGLPAAPFSLLNP